MPPPKAMPTPVEKKAAASRREEASHVHVVVGLGNPGARYEATRHNIGFMVLDELAGESGDWRARSLRGAESHTALIDCGRSEVLLVKPQTYMNRSGAAVASLRRDMGFEPRDLLVVADDFNLDFCRLRLRRGGGDGGHNGTTRSRVDDYIYQCGSVEGHRFVERAA